MEFGNRTKNLKKKTSKADLITNNDIIIMTQLEIYDRSSLTMLFEDNRSNEDANKSKF